MDEKCCQSTASSQWGKFSLCWIPNKQQKRLSQANPTHICSREYLQESEQCACNALQGAWKRRTAPQIKQQRFSLLCQRSRKMMMMMMMDLQSSALTLTSFAHFMLPSSYYAHSWYYSQSGAAEAIRSFLRLFAMGIRSYLALASSVWFATDLRASKQPVGSVIWDT